MALILRGFLCVSLGHSWMLQPFAEWDLCSVFIWLWSLPSEAGLLSSFIASFFRSLLQAKWIKTSGVEEKVSVFSLDTIALLMFSHTFLPLYFQHFAQWHFYMHCPAAFITKAPPTAVPDICHLRFTGDFQLFLPSAENVESGLEVILSQTGKLCSDTHFKKGQLPVES